MRVLCLGDIFGRSGRDAVYRDLSVVKAKYAIDFVIANAENAAHGFGITSKIAAELLNYVDVLTIGDHGIHRSEKPVFGDQIVHAGNYQNGQLGAGYTIIPVGEKKIAILCLLGQVFMQNETKEITNPFEKLDQILAEVSGSVDAIFLDFHAEATAEKQAMAFYADGRITAMFGTHTHVPTADARIFPKGMGYITDVGMCGNYDSVIGASPERALTHHVPHLVRTHLCPQDGFGQLSGVIFETTSSFLCDAVLALSPVFKIK